MHLLAIGIGIYSYIIFFLGITAFLFKPLLIIFPITIIIPIFLYIFKKHKLNFLTFQPLLKKDKIVFLIFLIICLQVITNFIGVLGPELGFDALWYHLTLSKLYIQNHSIFHIPGGLLYYSDMPKLTEMLYIPAIVFFNETGAKAIQFIFGIVSTVITYKIARNFLTVKFSLLSAAVFYSNLVVGWESISAYVDLARTFYESLAFLYFLSWVQFKKIHWIFLSALMLGFAISVKLLALTSLLIFVPLIIFYLGKKNFWLLPLYVFIVLIIPTPWFIFSYVHTGSPVYPFFSSLYPIAPAVVNPQQFFYDVFALFVNSPDPLSPLYILFLPFSFFLFKRYTGKEKIIFWYSILALLVWCMTPRTGGGRFILPFLPVFSVLVVMTVNKIISKQNNVFIFFLIMCSLIFPLLYRGAANAKFIPVVMGYETKSEFLAKHLNFSFGDFYDIDNFFKKNIKESDRVLLYGFHNLYYVNFPFIDSSWVKKGDTFNYIAVQNTVLPKRFSDWEKIYHNNTTHVSVYIKDKKLWEY